MTTKVLCVDDNVTMLECISASLEKQFPVDTAVSGQQALERMDCDGPYAVIVSDMQMPGLDGIQFLNLARQKSPDTIRIMLTGNPDTRTAIEAVNQGQIYQFLDKPCSLEALAQAVANGVKQYRLVAAEHELLEKTLNGSLKVLTEVLALIDPFAFGRSQTLRDYARLAAEAMQLPFTWELELAALLSPIGFISVPPALTQKARGGFGLSFVEQEILIRVPQVGSDLLANIPRLESVARIVLYQNKRFDGAGFPLDALKGEEIPLGSRIIKVLADLIQLESKKIPKSKALEKMQYQTGWYDPRVLEAVIRAFHLAITSPVIECPNARAVPFVELNPGQLLMSDVTTKDDALVVTAGTRVSALMLGRLKNFAALRGLKEPIYVAN